MKKEVKKTTEKYLTESKFGVFEKSFEKRMTDLSEIIAVILKEIRTIHEDNKYFRSNISNLNIEGSSYDRRIENLTVRVEKLELKAK